MWFFLVLMCFGVVLIWLFGMELNVSKKMCVSISFSVYGNWGGIIDFEFWWSEVCIIVILGMVWGSFGVGDWVEFVGELWSILLLGYCMKWWCWVVFLMGCMMDIVFFLKYGWFLMGFFVLFCFVLFCFVIFGFVDFLVFSYFNILVFWWILLMLLGGSWMGMGLSSCGS